MILRKDREHVWPPYLSWENFLPEQRMRWLRQILLFGKQFGVHPSEIRSSLWFLNRLQSEAFAVM